MSKSASERRLALRDLSQSQNCHSSDVVWVAPSDSGQTSACTKAAPRVCGDQDRQTGCGAAIAHGMAVCMAVCARRVNREGAVLPPTEETRPSHTLCLLSGTRQTTVSTPLKAVAKKAVAIQTKCPCKNAAVQISGCKKSMIRFTSTGG